MFDPTLKPSWMRIEHLHDEEIAYAYSEAVCAKEDYEYRARRSPMTSELWNRYVDAMCRLQRLVKKYNRSRKC